jgi:ankyrin repeat protein
VSCLIQNGADVNESDDEGWTSLHDVAEYDKNEEIVSLLIQNGADVDARSMGGQTPLIRAVCGNNITTAKILIQNGANVNCVSRGGSITPLGVASLNGYSQMLLFLLKNGAKLSKNYDGMTQIDILDNHIKNDRFDPRYNAQNFDSLSKTLDVFKEWYQTKQKTKFYTLGRFLHQKRCGIIVGSKICFSTIEN